jgi:hypothetical protein
MDNKEEEEENIDNASKIYDEIMDRLESLPPDIAIHMLGVCLSNLIINTKHANGEDVTANDVIDRIAFIIKDVLPRLSKQDSLIKGVLNFIQK